MFALWILSNKVPLWKAKKLAPEIQCLHLDSQAQEWEESIILFYILFSDTLGLKYLLRPLLSSSIFFYLYINSNRITLQSWKWRRESYLVVPSPWALQKTTKETDWNAKARFIIVIAGWHGPRHPKDHYLKTKTRKVTLGGFGVTGSILIWLVPRDFSQFLFSNLTFTCCLSSFHIDWPLGGNILWFSVLSRGLFCYFCP